MVCVSLPAFNKNVIPTVFIGRCYDHNTNTFISALRNHLGPDFQSLHIIHATEAERGALNEEGTLSDLYSIASEGLRHGWQSVLVFDPLSHRQVCRELRFGELTTPSAILLSVTSEAKESLRDETSRPKFVIQRLPWSEAVAECALQTPKESVDQRDSFSAEEGMKAGVLLHDPLARPFGDGELRSFTEKELTGALSSTQPTLPFEIWDKILSLVKKTSPGGASTSCIYVASDSWGRLDGGPPADKLPIQSLVPMSDIQARRVTQLADDVVQKGTKEGWGGAELGGWPRLCPATREDLLQLYAPVPSGFCDFFGMKEPGSGAVLYLLNDRLGENGRIEVVCLEESDHGLLPFRLEKFDLDTWAEFWEPRDRCRSLPKAPQAVEILYHPRQTFPPARDPRSAPTDLVGCKRFYLPVVLLSDDFAPDEMDYIKDELYTMTEFDIVNREVYHSDDDPRQLDVYLGDWHRRAQTKRVRIVPCAMHKLESQDEEMEWVMSTNEPLLARMVFADERTARDGSVIAARSGWGTRNFHYWRMAGREAYRWYWEERNADYWADDVVEEQCKVLLGCERVHGRPNF